MYPNGYLNGYLNWGTLSPMTWAILAAFIIWVLWRILGPAAIVIWRARRTLLLGLRLRLLHPRQWSAAKHEVDAGL